MLYLCWSHLPPRAPKTFEGWVSALSFSVPNDNVQRARLCPKGRGPRGFPETTKWLSTVLWRCRICFACVASSPLTRLGVAPDTAITIVPLSYSTDEWVFEKVVATELQHELRCPRPAPCFPGLGCDRLWDNYWGFSNLCWVLSHIWLLSSRLVRKSR